MTNQSTGRQAPFKIAQISDCHLSANPKTLYRGQNADAGLDAILKVVDAWQPDLLIGTGDLSEDASTASYQRLSKGFDRVSRQVCVLPGNHDELDKMHEHFVSGPWSGPLVVPVGAWSLVMLNSALAGRIDGVVAPEDIGMLQRYLISEPDRPVLLALHHQPIKVGAPWIDRYMLDSPGKFMSLVENSENVTAVVWGHVHQLFEARLGNTRMLSCPSTAANSRAKTTRFEFDPAGPACRWLELYPQGELKTGLFQAAR
jgi:Icc protein